MNVAENRSYVASLIFTTAAITFIQTSFPETLALPDVNVSYSTGEILKSTFAESSLSQYESIGFYDNKEDILSTFALKMLHQTQDLEPMFAEMIEERFWDLL